MRVKLDENFGRRAVERVSHLPGRSELLRAAITLCAALGRDDITGELWVVDAVRVREYRSGTAEE